MKKNGSKYFYNSILIFFTNQSISKIQLIQISKIISSSSLFLYIYKMSYIQTILYSSSFSSEKFLSLISLAIIGSFNAVYTQNYLSFTLAWLILISFICYDCFNLKCKQQSFLKLIILIKDYYFFAVSFLIIFNLVSFPHQLNYQNGLLDGLQIIILIKVLKPVFSKFFLLLCVNVLMIYFIDLKTQFILEIIFLVGTYLLHLFCKIRVKKFKLQAERKFCKNKKISTAVQEYLNLVFLGWGWGKKFILEKDLNVLQYKESLLLDDLQPKGKVLNDVLEEMEKYKYKIRKEDHERCFTEVELMDETLKNNENNDLMISFQDLTNYIFNERSEKVYLPVESHMEGEEQQLIYILRQKEKAFFRFISNDFAHMMNEKNGIIQSYSKAISFVSHEFRTPLNCIINMLQAIQHSLENELISNFIIPSLISSKFLLNLVNDLLDIAQLEAGKFKLIFLEFNLSALLEDTLQIISFQAINRKIELELEIDDDIVMAKSDPNRIRQIITNLLSNY